MKTETKRRRPAAKRVTVKGERMVMLPEDEYDRLLHKAEEWEPLWPAPASSHPRASCGLASS